MAISVQLGQLVKIEKTSLGKNNTPGVSVKYKRLDSEEQKELNINYLVGKLDLDSVSVLKALKPGDKFCVVKEKVGEYWNLKEFKTSDKYESVKSDSKPAYEAKPFTKAASTGRTYNEAGVKVGAIMHDAIALTTAGNTKPTLQEVAKVARQLLQLSFSLEAEVNDGLYAAIKQVDPTIDLALAQDTDDEIDF